MLKRKEKNPNSKVNSQNFFNCLLNESTKYLKTNTDLYL